MMKKRGQRYTDKKKKQMKEEIVAALQQSGGIISVACKACGITRKTVFAWRKEDPLFDEDCNEAQEIALDMAESSLLKQVQAGNVRAIKFYLQCKGRDRGYNPRILMDMNANVNADKPVIVFRSTAKPQEKESEE